MLLKLIHQFLFTILTMAIRKCKKYIMWLILYFYGIDLS